MLNMTATTKREPKLRVRRNTFELHDLEGAKAPRLAAEAFTSPTRAIRIVVNSHGWRAATAAGDRGALNVWMDKVGKIHVARYHNLKEVEHERFERQRDAFRFLRGAMASIGVAS